MMSVELKRWVHLLNDVQNLADAPESATDFELVLLICDLVSLIRPHISEHIKLEIEAAQAFKVNLPENSLRQVLLNLILNAAEATNSRVCGHICIKVYQSASGLILQVIDNGTGFEQALLERGIDSLQTCQQQGSGLGLAIAQQFIIRIGGKIKLSNRIPHGACISLFLPKYCSVNTF